MKTKLFLSALCLSFSVLLSAQLKVSNSGNVGINLGTSTPLSALSINGVGSSDTKVDVTGSTNGVVVLRTGTANSSFTYGVLGTSNINASYNIGIRGQSYSTTAIGSNRAWGLFGLAGNSTSGYNYGVFGTTYGSQNGAGIVGTTGNNQDVNISSGLYAGYFVGNVYVTGTLTGNPVVNSDKRYKQNIIDLDTKKALDNVLLMTPIEYNLKQLYTESKGDSTVIKKGIYDEKSQMFQKKHFGLIAQDLQKIYPDLVYEDDNGYLSVNYIGIIPLLIQSVKELKMELETLNTKNNNFSAPAKVVASSTFIVDETDALTYPVLEQNTPNPFNTETTIGFYLPTTIKAASIFIYDMNGGQLKNIPISERNKGNITIKGSEFSAGMYLYALIADGKLIDTKRMILTK